MRSMAFVLVSVALVASIWLVGGSPGMAQNPRANVVDMLDNCDPADPGYDPSGGCALKPKDGDVSFNEFFELLFTPLDPAGDDIVIGHPSWRNDPSYLSTEEHRRVRIRNRGGRAHSFTEVETGTPVPVVYPGSPEVTNFPNWEGDRVSEQHKGEVALVFFRRHPHPPHVRRETVGRFRWVAARCDSMESLRSLKARPLLDETVLKLELDLAVTLKEEAELELILRELVGGDAMPGRAAVVQLDRKRVELTTGDLDELLPRLPGVLRATVQRLREQAANDTEDGLIATRALRHLYQLVRKEAAP